MNGKRREPLFWLALIALAALVVAAALMAGRTASLSAEVRYEKSLTPTPAPTAFNVMQVTPDPNEPTPEPLLRNGSAGERVTAAQQRLQELGYYTGAIDGQFGPGTMDAVQRFQRRNGLEADGMIGSDTSAALYAADAVPEATATPEPTAAPEAALPWYTADGMPILVNRDHPLPDNYRTVELVNLTKYCDRSIVKIKANGIEGEKVAVDAMMTMFADAKAEGLGQWQVNAGWRSVKYQKTLFDNKVAEYRKKGVSRSDAVGRTRKTVQDPGCSEHHTGLAFDITVTGSSFKGTKQCAWITEHCWDYGFILRYPEDKTGITGISSEPWHFRYVGVEHARRMRDEKLCLEEYVQRYGQAEVTGNGTAT